MNSGKMTGDLAAMAKEGINVTVLNSEDFIEAISEKLKEEAESGFVL
jgi:isocitrate dehydrogenase